MVSRRVMSSVVLIGFLAASPLFAQDRQRQRNGGDRAEQQATGAIGPWRARAGAITGGANRPNRRKRRRRRRCSASFAPSSRRVSSNSTEAIGRIGSSGRTDTRRDYAVRRDAQRSYYGDRNYYGSSPNRNYGYYSNRGYGYYSNRGYGAHTVIVPRYISPRFVTVVLYRPYVYCPSIAIGVFYGTGGSDPYGYTPRGYHHPIVGRADGGLRITGVSRLAQVFADGTTWASSTTSMASSST